MHNIIVDYIQHSGSDLIVVNAARVSMAKESQELTERDERLINYLADHDHFTCFTHCHITLRETVPVFVARQRYKHTVGFTYNEESRRYIDLPPDFYRFESLRQQADNVKQGSSEESVKGQADLLSQIDIFNMSSKDFYQRLLDNGVCREQARAVLPQGTMVSYWVTGSLAAFARAYKLRADSHAQKEIQELATLWDSIITDLYPVSWAALTK